MPRRNVKYPVATTVRPVGDNPLVCTYHSTDVVIVRADGGVRLDSGGYDTATTKHRMNQYSPDWVGVYQHKHKWFVTIEGREDNIPFKDNMIVYADGHYVTEIR